MDVAYKPTCEQCYGLEIGRMAFKGGHGRRTAGLAMMTD